MPKKTSNLNLSQSQGKETTKIAPSIKKKNVITKNNLNSKSSTKSINKIISSKSFGKSKDLGDVLARYLLGNSSFQVKKSKILSDYDLTGSEKKENVRSSSINKNKTKVLYNNEKNYRKFEPKNNKLNSKLNEQLEPLFNQNFDSKYNIKHRNEEFNRGKVLKKKKSNLESKRINEMSRSIQKLDRIVADFKNDITSVLSKRMMLTRNSSLSTLKELSSNSDQNQKSSINCIKRSDKKGSNFSIVKNDKKIYSENKKSPPPKQTKQEKCKGSVTLKSLIPLYKNEVKTSDTKKELNENQNYNEFLEHLIQSRRLYLSEVFSEKKEIKDKKLNYTKFNVSKEIDLNEEKKLKSNVKKVKSICVNTDLVGDVLLKFHEEPKKDEQKDEIKKVEHKGDELKINERKQDEEKKGIVDKDREILYKTKMFDKIVEVFDKRLPILEKKEENVSDLLKMELFGKQNEMFDDKQLSFDFNGNDNYKKNEDLDKKNEDLDKKQESFYENPDLFDKQQQIYAKCNEIFENNPENLDKKEIFNKLQKLFNEGHQIFDRVINQKDKNQLKIDIFVDKQEIFGNNTEIVTKLQEAFDKEILESNKKSENIEEMVEVFDKDEKVFNKTDVTSSPKKNRNQIIFYQTTTKANSSDKDTEIMDKSQMLSKMQQVFNKNQEILNKNREILHKNQNQNQNKKKKFPKSTNLVIDQFTQTDPVPLDLISKKLPLEELLKPTKPITPNEDLRFSDPIRYECEQYDVAIQKGIDLTKKSISEFFGLIQRINEKSGDNKIDLYEDTCGLKYAKNPNKNLENAKNGRLDKILFKNFEKVEYYLRMVMYYYKLMVCAKSSVDKIIQKRFV